MKMVVLPVGCTKLSSFHLIFRGSIGIRHRRTGDGYKNITLANHKLIAECAEVFINYI